jgi:small subunit ribosomal protein S20
MPINKSQKKRVLITKEETARNASRKTEVKTVVKKFETAVAAGKIDEAKELLKTAASYIDAARVDGLFHINNASRKKARLSKMLDAAVKAAAAKPEEVKNA